MTTIKTRQSLSLLLLSVLFFLIQACGGGTTGDQQQDEKQQQAAMQEEDLHLHYVQVFVEGMTCDGCAGTVKGAVEGVDNVHSATATFEEAYAIAGYNEVRPDTALIREAITSAGYKVTGFKMLGHELPEKQQ